MMQMTDQELITALRRMAPETGSLRCLGCGYEYGCSLHGCLILRIAVDRLTELCAPPSNPPLTLEELREMDGEPVWVVDLEYHNPLITHWYIFGSHDGDFFYPRSHGWFCANNYGRTWLAYRRKPEK